jgi:hypothetical protein
MIHVMDVYLNYVTVLMEYVIFKKYAKQNGTVLSVTKVHVLYYINIVKKSGKCINTFKKEKKGKKTPLGNKNCYLKCNFSRKIKICRKIIFVKMT